MNEPHHRNPTQHRELMVAASTPVELLQAGLRAILDLARAGRQTAAPSGTVAIPIQGLGSDLGQLFLDLGDDLFHQLEEHGLDLDEVALDGLLRTGPGGYTAWGYLSGMAGAGSRLSLALIAESVVITPRGDGLTLTCMVRAGAA